MEPLRARGPKTRLQRPFVVILQSRVKPGARIAEAFTNIFAPQPQGVTKPRITFSHFGGPSEFTPSPLPELHAQEIRVGSSGRIPEPDPCEMQQLMDQNAAAFGGVRTEREIQHDLPFADVRGRVKPQRSERDRYWRSFKPRLNERLP